MAWRDSRLYSSESYFRLRVDSHRFDPRYLSALVGSPYGKSYFQVASKPTTNLATINQRQLKAFAVFEPPLEEQRRIVAYFDGLQPKVDALKQLQSQTQVELDALRPSVLDKAFRGELSAVPSAVELRTNARQLQVQTQAELAALLPSVLDKAFKGELSTSPIAGT